MKNGSNKAPKRVAIVGLGPSKTSYVEDVNRVGNRFKLYDEVWTFNTFCNVIESDRLFHMDDTLIQELRAEKNARVANMLEALKQYEGPIYTSEPRNGYPNMVRYPIEDIVNRFQSWYFTSTPPFALAYAMWIGVEYVACYGLDYSWPGLGEEAGRSCMEYWIGRAHQMGMEVIVHKDSSLLDAKYNSPGGLKIYGYDAFIVVLKEGKLKFIRREILPTAEEMEKRYYSKRPEMLSEG